MNEEEISAAVFDGIIEDILLNIKEKRVRAAAMLLYCGIDSMACLAMPIHQTDVTGSDFINWCDKYIAFPGPEQLTGKELWGARCGILHANGPSSKQSRAHGARTFMYCSDFQTPITPFYHNPSIVLVSVRALGLAFISGVERFLPDLALDPDKLKAGATRLEDMYICSPAPEIIDLATKEVTGSSNTSSHSGK